jgi:hypothetical protein
MAKLPDQGKPPLPPLYESSDNREFPGELGKKNAEAYDAYMKGNFKKAAEIRKEINAAIPGLIPKGITGSQLNRRTAELPLVRKHFGGKTRRGKRGAGVITDVLKTVGKSAAKSVANTIERSSSPSDAYNQLRGQVTGEGSSLSPEDQQQLQQMLALAAKSQGGRTTRRAATYGGDIVTHLLTIRNQVKLYHWQTGSFARHKATDDLSAALDLNIDAFVESYMGRYGRPKVSGSIKLHNFSESAAKSFVAKETKYLQKELPRKIGKNDTDLGDLTKVLYLFTLT